MAGVKAKRMLVFVGVLLVVAAAIIVIERPFAKTADETQGAAQQGAVPENAGAQQGGVPETMGKQAGQRATDLGFERFDDGRLQLSDFLGKQALVVNAWAAWCPFCVDEIPDLQRASDRFDDVTVIFVHRTATESEAKARSYLERFESEGKPITDPVVLDPRDSFYQTYFGFGMPVTIFIDKEGIVRERKVGPLTAEEIVEKMEALRS